MGIKPKCRFGHTMLFINSSIIIFGGYSTSLLKEIWIIQIGNNELEKSFQSQSSQSTTINSNNTNSYMWNRIELGGTGPCPRMYHSMSLCTEGITKGMIVVFGGIRGDGECLDDLWGLRKHRNGTWEWVILRFIIR